jgi:hypothetical protein
VNANAVHATGAVAGSLLLPPKRNHDHNALLIRAAGATRAAVITGADATAGIDTCTASESASEGTALWSELRASTRTESMTSGTTGSRAGTRVEETAAPLFDCADGGAVTPNAGA